MRVRIKRIDNSLPLPEYKTTRAAGFDVASRDRVEVAPKTLIFVALNVVIELPHGHMLLLAARSSLPKKGLLLANGVGIGDGDFCGEEDEYKALVYNFSEEMVVVERGERIAQGIMVSVIQVEFEEVERMEQPSRGGFGSTGRF